MRPRAERRVAHDGNEMNVLEGIIQALIKDSADALKKKIRREREEKEAEAEKKKQIGRSKIAPDGYIPNSMIRQTTRVHKYLPHVETQDERLPVKSDNRALTVAHFSGDQRDDDRMSITLMQKAHTEAMQIEAARYRISAVYNESKKMNSLLQEDEEILRGSETNQLRLKNRFMRKYNLRRLRRKLLRVRIRKELASLAKQKASSARKSIKSQFQVRLPFNKPLQLSDGEFSEMHSRVLAETKSQQSLAKLLQGALKDPPLKESTRKLTKILGSQENTESYLNTFKQPRNLLSYLIRYFGSSEELFHLINRALNGNLRCIYKVSEAVGFNFKLIINLLWSIRKTMMAATDCLITRPCNFYHVKDFIQILMQSEWAEPDLIDLANGRYIEGVIPGEKPSENPLLSLPTIMSEKAFLQFYRALHELNYHFLRSLGTLQYEAMTFNEPATRDEVLTVQYAKILNSMSTEENRRILRPRRALYRQLSHQALKIMPGGELPAFLSEYFAKLLEKQVTLICSQILEEVAVRRTATESISLSMNQFFEAFVEACFHIQQIMDNQINEKEVSDILVEVVKGNRDERDHLRSLIEPNIADFLIDALRILNGKIINAIMIYALTSEASMSLDTLLQNSIELNSDSPARPIIESWITLKDRIFLLANELKVAESISAWVNLMKHKKFLVQAGCEGMIAATAATPATDQGVIKMRRRYMPIHAVVSSFSESLLASGSLGSALKKKRDREYFIDNYRIMKSGYVQKENVKGKDAGAEVVSKFFMQESQSDSDDSNKAASANAPYHGIDPESAADALTEQIRKADQETSERTAVDKEQINLIDDSWTALTELQGQQQRGSRYFSTKEEMSLLKGLYYSLMKLTLWIRRRLGDKIPAIKEGTPDIMMEDKESLIKEIWKDLFSIKSSHTISSLEETYRKFNQYLKFLRSELSYEVQFLKEVDSEFLRGKIKETLVPRPGLSLEPSETNWKVGISALSPPSASQSEEALRVQEKTQASPPPRFPLLLKRIIPATRPKGGKDSTPKPKGAISVPKLARKTKRAAKLDHKAGSVKPVAEDKVKELSVKGQKLQTTFIKPVKSSPSSVLTDYSSESSTSEKDGWEPPAEAMDQKDVELQLDNIPNKAFPQRRMTLSASSFNRKKKQLAKILEKTGAYDKQATKQISDKLFTTGLSKVPPGQPAHHFAKLITDASLAGEPVAPSDIVTSLHRSSMARADKTIDWIDLIEAPPNIITISKASSVSSQTSQYRYKPSSAENGSTKLPPIQAKPTPKIRPSVKPARELSTLSLPMPTSETSTLHDVFALESVEDTVPLKSMKGRADDETLRSTEFTSSFGSWAYTMSTDIRSSEFSDRVFSEDGADLETRRTPKKTISSSHVNMSSFEVADHIANILEAVTSAGLEVSTFIRGVLRLLAENPPELRFLKKLARKFHPESSVFWNDVEKNGVKLQDVLEDIILDTAAISLWNLGPAQKDRLLQQTKVKTREILQNLAQIGSIVLSDESTQRLFKGMELLNSGVLLDKNSFQRVMPKESDLPDKATRWFKPFDVRQIFRPSASTSSVDLMADKLPSNREIPAKISQSGFEESAIVIADSILPLLPQDIVEAKAYIIKQKKFSAIASMIENRLRRRIRIVIQKPSTVNHRDITSLISSVIQHSQEVQSRVNRRLRDLDIHEIVQAPLDISNKIRMINRPSFIKPHEWTRLIGKSGITAFRFGDTALCHRGLNGALGPLIHADALEELSHKLVANYDLAHALNQQSLFQLNEVFGEG
ncbi:hypothetical protein Aperf_G00000011968 [Anoplocephala perfoliata]